MSSKYWHRLFFGRNRILAPKQQPTARRMRTAAPVSVSLEQLESRIVPTLTLSSPVAPLPLPWPAPLVPGPGDVQILENVLQKSVSNRPVLDHLPVPYVIDVSATNPTSGQVVTTILEGQAHTPIKIDADQSKSTGLGNSGLDIQVEVDAYVDPTPHLVMTVDRLGDAPYAQNLSVVVAFPFAGFDLEPGLPSTPNLVMGFQTHGAGDTVGGYAPQEEVMTLTPGILAGTSHSFQASMVTTGADNPLSFILGNLDGTNVTGTLNAAGLRAYVENVPATINLNVATVESPLGAGATNSSFALNWQASAASPVQMDYLENLTNPATATGPDFNTSLTANPMPTSEQFALALNEPAGTLTLSQQANAVVDQMTFQKTRSDGLAIVGNGSSVPTQTNLTVYLAGSATLTDNANIGSLAAQASQAGGFTDTSSFLGYDVGTVGFAVTNAPSMSASFSASGTTYTFEAAPVVAGETIGSVELLASSDDPADVQLPTRWSDPTWDVLSMVDTGTGDTSTPEVFAPGATAAARLLDLITGSSTLDTAPLSTSFDVTTTTATPLQSYLRTTPTSQLTPGHDDEITCELVDIPAGETKFFFNGPSDFGVTTNPPTSINDIHCFGHIDSLLFDIDAGGLPAVFSFNWDPDSLLTILAQDGLGGNSFVGHLAAFLTDPNGISLFSDAGVLFGTKLKEARLRVDDIPTFTGTWVVDDASGNTSIQFNTVAPGLYASGVQLAVSTQYNDPALANPLTPAAELTADYATFNDAGVAARNMEVGILGIDSFSYAVTNASDMVHIIWDDNQSVPFNLNVNSITGGVYFAGSQVMLNNYIALVPSHLDYETNLDPMVCYTGTNFIPSIDLTFDQNEGLPAGTTLTLQADNLPAVLCYDFEAAAGTITVTAQNADLSPATIGDLNFDLEAPDGLPGTASLLGASFKQARLRLDSVPSFTASWGGGSSTNFSFQSTSPGFFLGGAQLELGTADDPSPLAAASSSSIDYINLLDDGTGTITGASNTGPIVITTPTTAGLVNGGQVTIAGVGGNTNANGTWTITNVTPTTFTLMGSTGNGDYTNGGTWASLDKEAALGVFGISQVTVSADNSNSGLTLNYVDNAPRELQVNVNADFGQFFHNYDVVAMLDIQDLPQNFNFSSDFQTMVTYTASAPIASITAGGSFNDGTHGVVNSTFLATGLPQSLDFELDPTKSATLKMSDAISNISFSLSDNTNGLFGTPFELITATLNNIPANWMLDWSNGQLDVEAEDASNNPAPMGQVTATVSTSDDPMTNLANIMPFETSGPGGTQGAGGSRINYSPFLQDIDDSFYNAFPGGAPATLAAINDVYNNAQVLNAGEDHAVALISGGSLTFFDGQFTGFQKIQFQPNSNGGHFEFDAPTPGPHPFFAGVGMDSNFLYASIQNIPDSATLNIDLAAHDIHFFSSDSMGTIDVYYGPKWMAKDSDTALRAVMQNTPTDVHLTWGFGSSSGSAHFTASNPFTMLLLDQDGSTRMVAGLRLQDLNAGYSFGFSPSVTVGTFAFVPTSVNLSLFKASAGIDTGSGAPASGFFNLYEMNASPQQLNDGTMPGGPQYIPLLTLQLKDFTNFSIGVSAGIGLFPLLGVPEINGPNVSLGGQLGLQFWTSSSFNATVDLGPLGTYGLIEPPSYTDNSPIFIFPFGAPQFSTVPGYAGVITFGGFGTFNDLSDPLG